MSKSLYFRCNWLADEADVDPVDKYTFAQLSIYAGDYCITHLWDRLAKAESRDLITSMYPLVRWIVYNWWQLFFEPCRWAAAPDPHLNWSDLEHDWTKRHCLRVADPGTLLPKLYLYNDGENLRATWFADDPDDYPNMPGYFLYNKSMLLDRDLAMMATSTFVSQTLERIHDLTDDNDQSLDWVRHNWDAICNADRSERRFCEIAGLLGLDPYNSKTWPDDLVQFIDEISESKSTEPLLSDVMISSDWRDVRRNSDWARTVQTQNSLVKSPRLEIEPLQYGIYAAAAGSGAARIWRQRLGLGSDDPIHDVPQVLDGVTGAKLTVVDSNHMPKSNMKAVVGWQGNQTVVLAGPVPQRDKHQRFLQARALFHSAYSCNDGPRLVADSYSWDQQASRAFAAELLAPSVALSNQADGDDDEVAIERLADKYAVSTFVVSHQLDNYRRGMGFNT